MHTDTTRENPQASAPQAADSSQDLAATAPGQLRVIKRNGTVVPYTDDKITVAITKAFSPWKAAPPPPRRVSMTPCAA